MSIKEMLMSRLKNARFGANAQTLGDWIIPSAIEEIAEQLLGVVVSADRGPCYMCNNARVDDELTDYNDLSYVTVGKSGDGFRTIIGVGDGKPLRIETEMWHEKFERWIPVTRYHPHFCPNCGRKINEYEEKQK